VAWRDGSLAVEWSADAGPVPLDPTDDPDAFVVRSGPDAGERCVFQRGTDGSVIGLRFSGWPLARLLPAG
jgi:hypothetical protein